MGVRRGHAPVLACTHPQWATRTCLKCGQPFSSLGPHNRICEPCKNSKAINNGHFTFAEEVGRALENHIKEQRKRRGR